MVGKQAMHSEVPWGIFLQHGIGYLDFQVFVQFYSCNGGVAPHHRQSYRLAQQGEAQSMQRRHVKYVGMANSTISSTLIRYLIQDLTTALCWSAVS